MLVLARKEKEKLKLGDAIQLTVIKVSGDKVTIGIEAPSGLIVLREELSQTNPKHNKQAA